MDTQTVDAPKWETKNARYTLQCYLETPFGLIQIYWDSRKDAENEKSTSYYYVDYFGTRGKLQYGTLEQAKIGAVHNLRAKIAKTLLILDGKAEAE